MGTRHLVMAQVDGDYKLAQYGQWDGYPSGQGLTVLKFLRDAMDHERFVNNLRKSSLIDHDELVSLWEECGAEPGAELVSLEVAERFSDKYPHLSRDTGAKVLDIIQESDEGLKLKDSRNFAADSLFCEWAYVIDFDKDCLEVYRGVNKEPLDPSERFASFEIDPDECNSQYYQIKFVTSWSLGKLPTDEEFLKELEPEDED